MFVVGHTATLPGWIQELWTLVYGRTHSNPLELMGKNAGHCLWERKCSFLEEPTLRRPVCYYRFCEAEVKEMRGPRKQAIGLLLLRVTCNNMESSFPESRSWSIARSYLLYPQLVTLRSQAHSFAISSFTPAPQVTAVPHTSSQRRMKSGWILQWIHFPLSTSSTVRNEGLSCAHQAKLLWGWVTKRMFPFPQAKSLCW